MSPWAVCNTPARAEVETAVCCMSNFIFVFLFFRPYPRSSGRLPSAVRPKKDTNGLFLPLRKRYLSFAMRRAICHICPPPFAQNEDTNCLFLPLRRQLLSFAIRRATPSGLDPPSCTRPTPTASFFPRESGPALKIPACRPGFTCRQERRFARSGALRNDNRSAKPANRPSSRAARSDSRVRPLPIPAPAGNANCTPRPSYIRKPRR